MYKCKYIVNLNKHFSCLVPHDMISFYIPFGGKYYARHAITYKHTIKKILYPINQNTAFFNDDEMVIRHISGSLKRAVNCLPGRGNIETVTNGSKLKT